MRRRDFILVLGSAAAWPLSATAGQAAMPVIGVLSTLAEAQGLPLLTMFRRGLAEMGFVDKRNVAFEFRWARGEFDRLPSMAAELVRQRVTLLVAQAPPAALAAEAATSTIPIVFIVGLDPIGSGLVASLARPGGNATGMTLMSPALAVKRLEILRELVPETSVIAMLANPASPDSASETGFTKAAARSLGLQFKVFDAGSSIEIDSAFTAIAKLHPDAFLLGTDPFYMTQRKKLTMLAGSLGVPAIYPFREYADDGGLISYGTNIAKTYHQAGIYAGRILKGAEPGELPVQQPTNFELVINLRTAKKLGIKIPALLQATSDAVIE
jgi:ABC-type uncharacterized transport system substrate-binding protein